MAPKIIFHRSWIYDIMLEPLRDKGFKMPSDQVMSSRIRTIEKEWKKYGEKILKEISKVTKLKWHQKTTICYITAGIVPFSDPLTMNARKDPRRAIHVLTHEMIHRLLSESENSQKIQKNWDRLMRRYEKESALTASHIGIHAIHAHVILTLFDRKELKKEKAEDSDNPPYARAWEIVETEGYKNIVTKLTKGL